MNKEVENKNEFVDRDEEMVRRLIGDLTHVEAPANFERRVMSRIAEGETKSRSFFPLSALALATGAVIVLLIGSIIFFNMRRPATQENDVVQTPDAAPSQQTTAPIQEPIVPEPAQPQSLAQKQPDQLTSGSNSDRQKIPDRKSAVSNNSVDFHTSGDFTLRQARPIYPQGLKPNVTRSNVNTNEIVSPDAIPVQDILITLGVSAAYKNGWLVTSVSKNSSGERSGVKAGDIIDTIGDSSLSADTNYHGAGRFSTITVRRDGKSLVLKLK